MEILILGTGCPKCKSLERMVADKVKELGVDATVTKEQDIVKIMGYGILSTPGLVINGNVVLSGRLPSSLELIELITKYK